MAKFLSDCEVMIMTATFDPSPAASRAFRQVMCGERIVPLTGPSHLHLYEDGYHMADNLPGGAKIYYDIGPDGLTGIRLKAGKSFDLK